MDGCIYEWIDGKRNKLFFRNWIILYVNIKFNYAWIYLKIEIEMKLTINEH